MGTALSIIVTLFVSLMHPGKPAVQSNVQIQAQADTTNSPTETPSITPSVSPTDTPSVTPSVSPSVSPTISPSVSPNPSISPVPSGTDRDNDGTPFGWFVSEAAHVRNALRFDQHSQEKTEVKESSETQTDTK